MFQLLYEAKFRTVTNRVFDEEMILANLIDYNIEPSNELIMGVDLARTIDESAVVIYDLQNGAIIYTETFRGDWDSQIARLKQLIDKFKPLRVILDRAGPGDVVANELRNYPLDTIYISSKEKINLVQNAQLMFLRQRVKFNPRHMPKLLDQLSGYVYLNEDRTSFGPYTKSLHDDLVDALMLALAYASKFSAPQSDASVWRPVKEDKNNEFDISASKWLVDKI